MPFGLSSCNWIPDAGFRGSVWIYGEEGIRSWVVDVDRDDRVGASQEACLAPAPKTGLIPTMSKFGMYECDTCPGERESIG